MGAYTGQISLGARVRNDCELPDMSTENQPSCVLYESSQSPLCLSHFSCPPSLDSRGTCSDIHLCNLSLLSFNKVSYNIECLPCIIQHEIFLHLPKCVCACGHACMCACVHACVCLPSEGLVERGSFALLRELQESDSGLPARPQTLLLTGPHYCPFSGISKCL